MTDKKISEFTEVTTLPVITFFPLVNETSEPKLNRKISKANLMTEMVPYKKYIALLTQSSQDAPTAIVLENTFGSTPIYDYISVGEYTITLANAFTLNKTFIRMGNSNGYDGVSATVFGIYLLSTSIINIQAIAPFGASKGLKTNDSMLNTSIEIRVYP